MTTPTGALLQAALRYAELGYPVFPCAPGRKEPLTANGFLDATTSEEQIEQWWSLRPNANIAITTAGLLVVDVDSGSEWLSDDRDRQAELACGALSLTANGGRHYVFRQPDGRAWRNTTGALAEHVDTRADGGYILVPPSVLTGGKAYRWEPGLELDDSRKSLPEPPAWLVEQLDTLATRGRTSPRVAAGDDGANRIPSGQRNATLARLAGTMRRVGMSQAEILAALQRTNADRCNPPLNDGEVERIAASIARYEPDQVSVAVAENHWEQMCEERTNGTRDSPDDPGPIPDELLRVPGFVSEVMDYCMATAPYPNQALAFCGALAMQAFLAGRKVRDQADNRSNIYLLGLAYSAVGKDHPRKLNVQIAHHVGLSGAIGDTMASGEGIQDILATKPCMLFQTDEFDAILQSINKSKDARYEFLTRTLLTMYSSSNSVFPMRPKAKTGPNSEPPDPIDQPCLVIFGTAIPNHYYGALSERLLTNGFFARTLVVESGKRSEGQEPSLIDPPERIVETARWWADLQPGHGNLEKWHPVPEAVHYTPEAQHLLTTARKAAGIEYSHAEERGDPVGTTVWGRVNEQTRKLALLYAVSRNHRSPSIDIAAVTWADRFMTHQTRRMLFMAASHAADNPFHAECLKFLQKLRDAPDQSLPRSVALKRMKMDAQSFQKLIQTLEQQGDIEPIAVKTSGRTGLAYRLIEAG